MKISFSTIPVMDKSCEEISAIASRLGYDAVEIRGDNNALGLFGLPLSDAKKIKEVFDGYGVAISDIAAGIQLDYMNEELVEKLKLNLDAAKILGARGVRVFLGTFRKKFTDESKYCYEDIVTMLKAAAKHAESVGVEIWIETHNEFCTGSILKKLLSDVDSPSVKVIWDIIHPIEAGESPEETLEFISESIAHVHLKDGYKKADAELVNYYYTKLGEGTLPIEHIIRLLLERGYDGYFSLEWESKWKSEIENAYDTPEAALTAYTDFLKSYSF